MSISFRELCVLSWFLVLWLPAKAVWAADSATRSTARSLGEEGVEAYRASDYSRAIDRLERAYKVIRVPTLALWLGRALEANGKLVEASELYLEATRIELDASLDRPVQKEAQAAARAAHEKLLPRIPRLTVVIEGPSAANVALSIAGVPVDRVLLGTARPTNPGTFLVIAEHGSARVSKQVSLEEGKELRVSLSLPEEPAAGAPAPEPAHPISRVAPTGTPPVSATPSEGRWQPLTGWVTLGVGAAGVIVGGVAGIAALHRLGELDCPDNACPASTDPEKINAYHRLRTLSSVGFISGGALAALGVTLILTTPRRSAAPSLTARVRPTSLELRGTF